MYGEQKLKKRKILCGSLVLLVFLASAVGPNTSYALSLPSIPGLGGLDNVPTSESGDIHTKEVGPISSFLSGLHWDALAWTAAKYALRAMTSSIVSWVNNGFRGGPFYATDPEKFFSNLSDNVSADFIQSIGASALCSPFQLKIQIAVRQAYSDSRFGSRSPYAGSCTLSGVVKNMDQFLNGDFSQGGWAGWFALTQTPTNNPYGALANVQGGLNARLSAATNIASTALNWGRGFISWSDCLKKDANGVCTQNGPTKTPGSVIESELENRLGSNVASLEIASNINEVVSAVATELTSSIFGGGGAIFSNSPAPVGVGTPSSGSIIYLFDPNPVNLSVGDIYTEPGYAALDPYDGDLTSKVVVNGNVNTSVPGVYPLIYSVTDSHGQNYQQTRIVNVGRAPIAGTCTPDRQTVSILGPVKWTVTPSGGSGTYIRYQWDGTHTDLATGQNLPATLVFPTITLLYGDNGPKNVNVTVIDADPTVAAGSINCGSVQVF